MLKLIILYDCWWKSWKILWMAAGYNINKQLKIDLQICCAELTRKSKKAITPSSTIRLLVVQFLLENKKKD